MELSPVFKQALGAVWTAGYRPESERKFELQRACGYFDTAAAYRGDGLSAEQMESLNGFDRVRAYIEARAIAALESLEYPLAEKPSGLDLLQPLPHLAESLEDPRPFAGDVVRCRPFWTLTSCTEVALQGQLGEPQRAYTIANRRGGWHIGTKPNRPNFLSMGCGGPASILPLNAERLQPTGETDRLSVWDFAFTPQAHHGVYFLIPVRVFDWEPAEGDFITEETGESVNAD